MNCPGSDKLSRQGENAWVRWCTVCSFSWESVPGVLPAEYAPEHAVENRWVLSRALEFVRMLQSSSMENGWCLMLAGGVLNNGHSANDLDLLAYPRTRGAVRADLMKLLPEGSWSDTEVSKVFRFEQNGLPVELIFQTWVPR